MLETGVTQGQPRHARGIGREHAVALAEMVTAGQQQIGGAGLDRHERPLGSTGHERQDLQAHRADGADAVAAHHDVGLIELEPVGIQDHAGPRHLEQGRVGRES